MPSSSCRGPGLSWHPRGSLDEPEPRVALATVVSRRPRTGGTTCRRSCTAFTVHAVDGGRRSGGVDEGRGFFG